MVFQEVSRVWVPKIADDPSTPSNQSEAEVKARSIKRKSQGDVIKGQGEAKVRSMQGLSKIKLMQKQYN